MVIFRKLKNIFMISIYLKMHKLLKSFPLENKDCWCHGDVWSQGISSHGIDWLPNQIDCQTKLTTKPVSAPEGLLKIYVEIPQNFASHFLLENLAICFVWCLLGGQPMPSSNGNIFHITDPLCREFTSRQWIPLAKVSDVELWCFLWPAPEVTVELVNNRDASDLRRHHTHYDITVMCVWSNGD